MAGTRPYCPGLKNLIVHAFKPVPASYELLMKRLDEFVHEENIQAVDFIKCDVEGAELNALRGGMSVIREFKPAREFEMMRKWSAKHGYNPNDIISLLRGEGYRCYAAHCNKLRQFDRMDASVVEMNFYFIHESKSL